uniref:CARD domain-containing protein n=1 Tax=Oryzias sinensis TaxID=183150 RepID=A0A8C7WUT8_9TELE
VHLRCSASWWRQHKAFVVWKEMEEKHKRILRRNRVHLVKELDLSDLCDVLLRKDVFTQSMINDIKVGLF